MKSLHFASGIIISIFVITHLYNHILAYYGPDYHIKFMENARLVYRHRLVEIILLFSVFTQLLTGLILFYKGLNKYKTLFDKIQDYSGLYLSFFFSAHISAILVARYADINTNFNYGHGAMNTYPQYIIFIPYYSLSIICFFAHVACTYQKVNFEKNFWI